MKTIYIATDHAGFELKNTLVSYIKELGYTVHDIGAHEYQEGDDYPDIIANAAESISRNSGNSIGIVLGGSGTGEAIVANKYPGIRACVYYGGDIEIVKLAREHNDANVISLGARFLSTDEAKLAIKTFLEAQFSGEERHQRRIKKIDNLNSK